MLKHFAAVAILTVAMTYLPAVPATAAEDGGNAWHEGTNLEDLYFSGQSVTLTEKEQQAIEIAKGWAQGEILTQSPILGPNGAIEYIYGAERPSIVCAVMQITDIELERAEKVTSVNLGDSVRWKVSTAVSEDEKTHIIVQPRAVGLDTSMIITTDKRTYRLRLRSHRYEYMPYVKFTYMETALAKWNAIQTQASAKRERETIPETNEYLGDLYFEYTVTGRAAWKPVRVYNDATKTIIEMPDRMRQTEAPTLLVVQKEGRILKKSEQTLVNYRVQGRRYIVDSVFDKAVMIVGVGGNQDRVTITRKPKAGEK